MSVNIPLWLLHTVQGLGSLILDIEMVLADYCAALDDMAAWPWKTGSNNGASITASGGSVSASLPASEIATAVACGFKATAESSRLSFTFSSSLQDPGSATVHVVLTYQDGSIEDHYWNTSHFGDENINSGSWLSQTAIEPCCPARIYVEVVGYGGGVDVQIEVVAEGAP